MRHNTWHQMSPTYWMCTYYDVYFEYGRWVASFYLGRAYRQTFHSAQAAMRYADVKAGSCE